MTHRLRARRPSPALVISALALFFAIGGSAFAVGQRMTIAGKCANGAVKGFAVVTGDPTKGIQNIRGDFSASAALFGARYNCTGRGVQVRRLSDNGGFVVNFVGLNSKVALATVVAKEPGAATVTRMADGSFEVITAGNQSHPPPGTTGGQFNYREDLPFVIVVF